MIGAPATKREKLLLYTVGLPFLTASIAWYDAKKAAGEALRRVRRFLIGTVPATPVHAAFCAAHEPGSLGYVTFRTWLPHDGPRETFIGGRLMPHEADLFHFCFAVQDEPRSALVSGFLLIGPDMFAADTFGHSGGREGLNTFRIENIEEFRSQVRRVIEQRGKA